MVKKEDIPLLHQLIETLEETVNGLEGYYKDKDFENFNQSKKFMLEIQKKITKMLK